MRRLLLLSPLALTLSACTISLQPNTGLQANGNNLIANLRPDRGEGAVYRVGDDMRISITTRSAGYLTLIALQSNGYTSTLVRNAYISAGNTVFPRAEDGVTYTVGEPRGLQRVRAIFTRVRPTTDWAFGGVYDGQRWNDTTNEYVAPYSAADRDVQETYLTIR